ncbi:hypothetical protein [Jeongeupia sp. USM3]|uniref:hypothetical protein n=1 Tax=Jeongeupia sp. USM3 TaxID=1906741 RepID=UPI00089DDD3A|nr:hypothetical protein [Jeongeupia sp. USM3]AOY00117.1 hypothetical protein BJP62_06420 [Jeongeupia sp. USM3]
MPRHDARTHYEAMLDIGYGYHFNDLCERLYRRVDFVFGAIGLIGGCAAATALLPTSGTAVAIAGITLAGNAIIERLIGASARAERHNEFKRRYWALRAEATGLTTTDLDRKLAQLQADGPNGLNGLASVAYNANVLAAGRDDATIPTSRWSRLLACLA